MGKPTGYFTKEDIGMRKDDMKRCSTLENDNYNEIPLHIY